MPYNKLVTSKPSLLELCWEDSFCPCMAVLYGLCGAQSVLPQPEANIPQYVSHASWLQQV